MARASRFHALAGSELLRAIAQGQDLELLDRDGVVLFRQADRDELVAHVALLRHRGQVVITEHALSAAEAVVGAFEREAAKLRAAHVLGLLDSGLPLDFVGADAPGEPDERLERLAVRFGELSQLYMAKAEKARRRR